MSAMRRVQFGFLACALFLAGAGQDAMNDETAQSVDATVDENVVLTGLPVPNLRERLEALNPSDPMAYFTLAEEVAYEADTRAERVLARQLYVLAYEIDHGLARASGRTGTLTPSVCLGLAALADRADEVLWLRALSRSVDDRWEGPNWEPPTPGRTPQAAALELATAIGFVRSGEGRRAEKILDDPEVAELLARYETLVHPLGLSGGEDFLRRHAREWPTCPECRNRRVTTRMVGGTPTQTLCLTCRGNPGPRLSSAEFTTQLRLEAALLHGIHRSWSAQVIADSGAPLRDLDPSELRATYRVDPARPFWREGEWRASGS